MPVRRILVWGDPPLEAPNQDVTEFGPSLDAIITDLFETSWAAPGLGLAAPQIGVNLRLAVVDLSVGKDPEQKIVLANPEIVHSEGRIKQDEGCLSFPGLFTSIERPRKVVVRSLDASGAPQEIEGDGLLGQAFCHEIDHLDGRLIVHHLRGLKRSMFVRKVNKLREAGAWGRC
jgi:peptide deformylase